MCPDTEEEEIFTGLSVKPGNIGTPEEVGLNVTYQRLKSLK